MRIWKRCGLVLKMIVLTIGYSGLMIHTGPTHPGFREVLVRTGFQLEETTVPEHFIEIKEEKISFATVSRVPIENPARNPSKPKKDIEAPCKAVPSPGTERKNDPIFQNEIKKILDEALAKYPLKNKLGLYIQELKTGYSYGVNDSLTVYDESDGNTDGYFRAASVVKLQVAFAVYRLLEEKELDEEKEYYDAVTKKNFYLLPALHTMVSRSDNNLLNTMLRLAGREKINRMLVEYGVTKSPVYGEINPAQGWSGENNLKRHGTQKVGGKITPKDMGKILEAVFREKDTNQYMGFFNEALIANIYATRIPKGIRRKYPVAHKTGTAADFGVYNDAGIVYCKNPYILVVLTKGETSRAAEGLIRELSEKLTDYMDHRGEKRERV